MTKTEAFRHAHLSTHASGRDWTRIDEKGLLIQSVDSPIIDRTKDRVVPNILTIHQHIIFKLRGEAIPQLLVSLLSIFVNGDSFLPRRPQYVWIEW